MLKTSIRRIVREHCPKNKSLRSLFSKRKVDSYKKYCLEEKYVLAGEQGVEEIADILKDCRDRWPSEYEHIAANARKLYERAGRVLSEAILQDTLFCYFAYGFMPDEYLSFGFKNLSAEERREFASDRDRNIIIYSINDIIEMDRFLNKWKTYQAYWRYYGREVVALGKGADYKAYFDFVQAHDRFVFKEVRLSKGDSVHLVKRAEIDDLRSYFEDANSFQDGAILEELIVQSSVMSTINPTSVNTVRVIVLSTEQGIEILDCFLKAGRNGSFVDNGGAGGILAGIDKRTGVLDTDGRDEFANVFVTHPDSGLQFKGLRLPDWDSLIAQAKEISSFEESIPFIGWDFAHTETGWIVVEGNASGQLIGPQLVTQSGSRKRMLEALNRVKQIVPIDL